MITFSPLGQAGRLGNQLWQIASTLGIAHARREFARFPPWDYQSYFGVPDSLFTGGVGTEAHSLVPHIDDKAAVYLQDYGLWQHMEDVIRLYFSPSPLAYATLIAHPLYKLLTTADVVSLHVRRGDAAYDPGVPDKYLYHPLRSHDYYRRGLERFPGCDVVVFSDDLPWCREHIPPLTQNECHFFEGGAPRPAPHEPEYATVPVMDWIDLLAMTLPKHHIISNSTFAFWGAFVSGDSAPIYPSNWFGPKLNYIDSSRMFPPTWVELLDPTEREHV